MIDNPTVIQKITRLVDKALYDQEILTPELDGIKEIITTYSRDFDGLSID